MKRQTRAMILVFAAVVVMSAASAGLFVAVDSRLGVVTAATIPLVLVVAAYAYVRVNVSASGTNESQYVRRRAREVGERLRDDWRTLEELTSSYPDWDEDDVRRRTESLVADFESQGATLDRETGSFSLAEGIGSADLEEIERIDAEREAVAADRDEAFHGFVARELESLATDLEELADAGLIDEPAASAEPPSPADATERDDPVASALPLDEYRTLVDDAVEEAIDTLRETERATDESVDPSFEESLDAAADAAADGAFDAAVDDLLAASRTLEQDLSTSFADDRETILSFVQTVEDVDAERFVDAEPFETVADVREEVSSLESALDIESVRRHRRTLREAAVRIVRELQSELESYVRTLEDERLPSGYYARPAAADEEYATTLESIDHLPDLEAEWREAATDLVDAVREARIKATVVEAYDDVAETIESELRADGEVTAESIPVRHAEQFFGLYFRRNPDVEFDPGSPALRLGDVETYEVDVTASFPTGGDERTVTASLSGDGYDRTETLETHVVGSTTFEDVPYGEYDLTVRPADDDYAPVERTVSVDGDTDVSVDLEEVTLTDRLTDGIEADLEEHVDEFADRLSDRFADDGYLSTEMSYPIADDYVPGLLATWAEREGYAVTRTDEAVVVYDRHQLEQEIYNVIQYNLDDGDELTYERIRTNYLSVPIGDEAIETLAEDANASVDVIDGGLAKPEEADA